VVGHRPLKTPVNIADLRVEDLIAHIGSSDRSPGAGSAGAVALVLAAACASKAVSVSLKHRSDDPELWCALESCTRIARTDPTPLPYLQPALAIAKFEPGIMNSCKPSFPPTVTANPSIEPSVPKQRRRLAREYFNFLSWLRN
jgi:hypothetical protein